MWSIAWVVVWLAAVGLPTSSQRVRVWSEPDSSLTPERTSAQPPPLIINHTKADDGFPDVPNTTAPPADKAAGEESEDISTRPPRDAEQIEVPPVEPEREDAAVVVVVPPEQEADPVVVVTVPPEQETDQAVVVTVPPEQEKINWTVAREPMEKSQNVTISGASRFLARLFGNPSNWQAAEMVLWSTVLLTTLLACCFMVLVCRLHRLSRRIMQLRGQQYNYQDWMNVEILSVQNQLTGFADMTDVNFIIRFVEKLVADVREEIQEIQQESQPQQGRGLTRTSANADLSSMESFESAGAAGAAGAAGVPGVVTGGAPGGNSRRGRAAGAPPVPNSGQTSAKIPSQN